MFDVMFYEVFEEEKKEITKILPKDIRAAYICKTIQEAKEASPPADLISIRTQSKIPADWAQKVKGVLTRSQGHDHLAAFRQETKFSGALGFLGSYCSRAVAEQAACVMMALLRRLKKQEAQLAFFSRDGLTGGEARGRKALVIGVGNIGREVVDILQGLRMQVKGVDIEPKLDDLEHVPLTDGLAWAQVIFCALPLTEQTKGMLTEDVLSRMPPGGIFINIARGEIAPLKGLQKLLAEGKLAGLGLDVYEQEGVLADDLRVGDGKSPQAKQILKLSEDPRVILTPHNAFNTQEALQAKASLTVAAVVDYLSGGKFPFCVPKG